MTSLLRSSTAASRESSGPNAGGGQTLDDLLKRAADFDRLSIAEKFAWFQEQANTLTLEIKAEETRSHEHYRELETCEARVLEAAILADELSKVAAGWTDLYKKYVCEIYKLGFTIVDFRKAPCEPGDAPTHWRLAG